MKNLLLITCFIAISNFSFGKMVVDLDTISPKVEERIYGQLDSLPLFPNNCIGIYKERRNCSGSELENFIKEKITYKGKINTSILAVCMIEEDGSISNIKIENSPNSELTTDITKVFQSMPKWMAGMNKGKAVRTQIDITIYITIKRGGKYRDISIGYISERVDKAPMFPNECQGTYAEQKECSNTVLLEFVYKNMKYPIEASKKGIEGMVVISFVVEKNGSISNIKVLREIGGGCDEEVIRVIKSMPRWEAAILEDKPVRMQFNLPVRFRLE